MLEYCSQSSSKERCYISAAAAEVDEKIIKLSCVVKIDMCVISLKCLLFSVDVQHDIMLFDRNHNNLHTHYLFNLRLYV